MFRLSLSCLMSDVWWSRVLHENDGRGRSNQAVKKKTEEKEQWGRCCEKNFFDFECTQDERIQCNECYQPQQHIVFGNCNQSDCHTYPCQQGYFPKKMSVCANCHRSSCGSFRHVSNLCDVHKVCEECIVEDEIDKYSFCMFVSTKSEYSRVLTHVTNSVNGWFRRKIEESRIFWHNFRGYDSYPIVSYMYMNEIAIVILIADEIHWLYEFHPNSSLRNSKSFQSFRVGQKILSSSLQQMRESEDYP